MFLRVLLNNINVLFFIISLLIAFFAFFGALFSEIYLGYFPCKLCFIERWPYYIGIPIGIAALIANKLGYERTWLIFATCFVIIFIASFTLGFYHAGIEWKLWAGPKDCSGNLEANVMSFENFHNSLKNIKVVLCDEAPARILKLSFAGWNAFASLSVVLLSTFSLIFESKKSI